MENSRPVYTCSSSTIVHNRSTGNSIGYEKVGSPSKIEIGRIKFDWPTAKFILRYCKTNFLIFNRQRHYR